MNNKIGFHMNYFRGTPYEFDVLSALRRVHAAGGQALEVMPVHLKKLTQNELNELKTLIGEWEIDLICGAGRTPQTDASSPDPAIREASFKASEEILALLHFLGGHRWDGLVHAAWPGKPSGLLTVEEKQNILLRCQREMQRILPIAEEYEINLCFEVVNRFEHYLINTAAEGVDFCKALDHPRAKLLLDVFHMNIEENDICAAITDTLRQGCLDHFHVCEANRCVPGTVPSHVDWNGVFSALAKGGYSGSIILEPFILTGIPFTESSCIWRDLSGGADFERILDYVDIGIDFVRCGMDAAAKAAPDIQL